MRLTEAVKRRQELKQEIAQAKEAHDRAMIVLHSALQSVDEAIAVASTGLDSEKVAIAETVIYVSGEFGYGDDFSAVRSAISDIADGCKKLRREYFGTKNYDRFHHQGSNHSYGYGPRHGSIVFSIGLRDRKKELTADEQDAAIYYLLNLKAIMDAKAAAKAG